VPNGMLSQLPNTCDHTPLGTFHPGTICYKEIWDKRQFTIAQTSDPCKLDGVSEARTRTQTKRHEQARTTRGRAAAESAIDN